MTLTRACKRGMWNRRWNDARCNKLQYVHRKWNCSSS